MIINRLINDTDLSEENIDYLVKIMPFYVERKFPDFYSFMEYYFKIVIKESKEGWPFINSSFYDFKNKAYIKKTDEHRTYLLEFVQTKPNTIKSLLIATSLLKKNIFSDKLDYHQANDVFTDILAFLTKKGRQPRWKDPMIAEVTYLNSLSCDDLFKMADLKSIS